MSVLFLNCFDYYAAQPHESDNAKRDGKERRQEAGTRANDDEDNEDCPKDYSNHGCIVLGVVIVVCYLLFLTPRQMWR